MAQMNPEQGTTPHKIVYISHGGGQYYDQTRYSVLTLLHQLFESGRSDIGIHIYTDDVTAFPKHPLITCRPVSRDDLKRFRGPHDFVHRIKLELLRRAETQIGLPLIYVDSDTRWISIPDQVLQSLVAAPSDVARGRRATIYLHAYEEPVSPSGAAEYFRLLSSRREALGRWGVDDEEKWRVWNAGTIGVSAESAGFFGQALELTDYLYPDATIKLFVEQLAVSLLAGANGNVEPFEPYLTHYWRYGNEFPVAVGRWLNSLPSAIDAQAAAKAAWALDLSDPALESIKHEPEFRRAQASAKRRKSIQKRKQALHALWKRWFGM